MRNLPAKVALITGATGGIGMALAAELAPYYRLLLVGRDHSRLSKLTAVFRGSRALCWDLSRPDTWTEQLSEITQLDALIHNAGTVELGRVEEASAEVWQQTMQVNLIAPALLTRALLPTLRQTKGQVIFVNSGAGLNAAPGWSSYAASKFGLRALADSLRAEEAQHGVRVTSVFPGRVATPMQRKVRSQEGKVYQADTYIQPATLAQTILGVLQLPPDALLAELSVKTTSPNSI